MSIKVNQQNAHRIPRTNNAVSNLTVDTPILNIGDISDVFWNVDGFTTAQINLRGSGLISASIDIEVSLDGIGFSTLQTIAVPAGTGFATVGAQLTSGAWTFIRAKVSAAAGTISSIDVLVRDNHNGV